MLLWHEGFLTQNLSMMAMHFTSFVMNLSFSKVWAGPLSESRLVVVLWNRCQKPTAFKAKWESIGLESSAPVSVRGLWKKQLLMLMTMKCMFSHQKRQRFMM